MQILPIVYANKLNFTSNKGSNINPLQMQTSADSFECSKKSTSSKSCINSKTVEMFLNTDYTPKIEPRKGYQRSFVFDRETLEPVDIYIKCVKENLQEKEYHLFRKNSDGGLKLVGMRSMTFDTINKKIAPGSMESFDKTLVGPGVIEHLLAVKEMVKKGYKGIKLSSLPDAYAFHKKLGFQSTDYCVFKSNSMMANFIAEWGRILKADDNTILQMLVRKNGMLNYNKTLENFVIFAKEHDRTLPYGVRIEMELAPQALNELKNLIKSKKLII